MQQQQQKLDGKTVDRSTIFVILRKVSVIQHTVNTLELELKENKDKIFTLEEEGAQENIKRKLAWIKEKKFEHMLQRVREEKFKVADQLDETEQEEVLYGKRNHID